MWIILPPRDPTTSQLSEHRRGAEPQVQERGGNKTQWALPNESQRKQNQSVLNTEEWRGTSLQVLVTDSNVNNDPVLSGSGTLLTSFPGVWPPSGTKCFLASSGRWWPGSECSDPTRKPSLEEWTSSLKFCCCREPNSSENGPKRNKSGHGFITWIKVMDFILMSNPV